MKFTIPMSNGLSKTDRIFVAGHRGLVGSAFLRRLKKEGYTSTVTRTHHQLDLTDGRAVRRFFQKERPEYVILAAAKVGGIHANDTYPAEFIQHNLAIQTNLIHEAWLGGVKGLLFLGSSCIYPRDCPQPIKEEYLLTGPLESTNRSYALAKIAGIEMCWAYNRQYGSKYRAVMPTNLYGPGDNFHPENSHVIPGLLRKFHEAKVKKRPSVEVWGTGKPRREFLHVDDLVEACLHVMLLDQTTYESQTATNSPFINVGTGIDLTISELAESIMSVVGYTGTIVYNTNMPDGTSQKLLAVSRLHTLGWQAHTTLVEGLQSTYKWFLRHQSDYRA